MAESPTHRLSRSACFPPSFVFGIATSSVQIEGGTSEGGRGPGIWDTFANVPGKITDGSTPAVACDHFHRFREDILEMKTLGVEAYRFSISWPRLFPDNCGKLNEKGVAFYNAIVDSVVEAGLTPCVTLYHWDLPQFLEDDPEVKGWRTKNIVKHFAVFANACFNCFGDRVKHWITFNETYMVAILAHGHGYFAPGTTSNKSSEPYMVAHHQLLAHSAAVKIYRADYQEKQKGIIGVAALVRWAEPFTTAQEDKDAAERWQQFQCAWLLDPIQFGDYPQIMRELVGDRLPRFSPEEIEELKGSVDFIGVNYYTACWAMNAKEYVSEDKKWWENDMQADTFWRAADGKLIGELMGPPGLEWFRSCAGGLRKILTWIKTRYGNIPLYITENGTLDPDGVAPLEKALDDQHRIKFISEHLLSAAESIREDHVNLKGFFLWTYMDCWEWMCGFDYRFGFYYVDFNHPKLPRFKSIWAFAPTTTHAHLAWLILHQAIWTSQKALKINKETIIYYRCHKDVEDIPHLFFSCKSNAKFLSILQGSCKSLHP